MNEPTLLPAYHDASKQLSHSCTSHPTAAKQNHPSPIVQYFTALNSTYYMAQWSPLQLFPLFATLFPFRL